MRKRFNEIRNKNHQSKNVKYMTCGKPWIHANNMASRNQLKNLNTKETVKDGNGNKIALKSVVVSSQENLIC